MSALQASLGRLTDLDAHVMGISMDSTAAKAAWARSLGGIDFDLLSDFYPHGAVAEQYGVLRPEGFAERAIFVVDKTGTIAFAKVYDIPSTPDLESVIAALTALAGR
jgi:peroxiredoxin